MRRAEIILYMYSICNGMQRDKIRKIISIVIHFRRDSTLQPPPNRTWWRRSEIGQEFSERARFAADKIAARIISTSRALSPFCTSTDHRAHT